MTKYCSICSNQYVKAQDDFKDDNCAQCNLAGYPKHASYWTNYFKTAALNTLSDKDSKRLKSLKASGQDYLVDRQGLGETHSFSSGLVRNIQDTEMPNKNAFTLNDVKAQVKDLLPEALEALGIRDAKINLIADLLVPARINAPIQSPNPQNLIRSAIMDVVQFLNIAPTSLSGGLKPHGVVRKIANGDQIMDEGLMRLQPDMDTHIRTLDDVRDLEQNEGAVPMNELDAIQVDENAMPAEAGMEGIAPEPGFDEAMVPDPNMESEIAVGAEPMAMEAPMGEEAMPSAPMYEGINKHGPMPGEEEFLEEEAPQYVPEGSMRRVEQSFAPKVRPIPRTAKKVSVKEVRPEMFTFAGRIAKHLPVQSVELSDKERNVITAYQALNFVTAKFNDGFQKTYSYYKTDKGYLFVEPDLKFAFHANSENDFLNFVQTNSSFSRWAFLPENLVKTAGGNPFIGMDPNKSYNEHASALGDDEDEDEDYAETVSDIKTRNREMGNYAELANDEGFINRVAICLEYFEDILPQMEATMRTDMAITAARTEFGPAVAPSPLGEAEAPDDIDTRHFDEDMAMKEKGKVPSADNPSLAPLIEKLNYNPITEPQQEVHQTKYPGAPLAGTEHVAPQYTAYNELRPSDAKDGRPFVQNDRPVVSPLVDNHYTEENPDFAKEAPVDRGDNPLPVGKQDLGARPNQFNNSALPPGQRKVGPSNNPVQKTKQDEREPLPQGYLPRKQMEGNGQTGPNVPEQPERMVKVPGGRMPDQMGAPTPVSVPPEKADLARRQQMLRNMFPGAKDAWNPLPGQKDRVAMTTALDSLVKNATNQLDLDFGLEFLIVEAGFDPEELLKVYAGFKDGDVPETDDEMYDIIDKKKKPKTAGFEVAEVPKPETSNPNEVDDRPAPMNATPKGVYESKMDKKEKKLIKASEEENGSTDAVSKIAPKEEADEDAKHGLHSADKTEHGLQDSDDKSGNQPLD